MIESRRDTSEISDSISIRVLKRAGVDLIDHGSLPPSWSGAEGLVQMDSRGHAVSCEFMNRRSSGTVVASEWFISFAGRIEIPRSGRRAIRVISRTVGLPQALGDRRRLNLPRRRHARQSGRRKTFPPISPLIVARGCSLEVRQKSHRRTKTGQEPAVFWFAIHGVKAPLRLGALV